MIQRARAAGFTGVDRGGSYKSCQDRVSNNGSIKQRSEETHLTTNKKHERRNNEARIKAVPHKSFYTPPHPTAP